MKLNTESPYHHTYPNEHAAKIIFHNDDHFILPRDDHFTTDILEIGNVTLKEGNHGVKYPNENESCKVTLPPQPHGIVNMEDYKIRNLNEYDCVGTPYSAPYSDIGLVVKEDFYANKAIAKAELSEKIVCLNDGSCHRVENLSVAEEVHSFQNNSAEKEEGGQKVPLCSNNSLKNENNDAAEEMEGTTISHDLEYELTERDSSTIVDKKPEDPTSVNKSVEDFSCSSSIEVGDELDTAERVANSGSCHRLENLSIAEEVHFFQNSLAEEEEVGQKALFCSNNSLNNDNNDVANKMKRIASSHGFEHAVVDKGSITSLDRNSADPTSIDKSVEKISCVSSTESGYKLYTAEWASNVSEDGDVLDRNESTTCNILDEITGKQLPPDDLNKESLQEDLSIISCSDDQRHSTDRTKIDQVILEGSKTTSTTVLSAAEDVDGDKEIFSTCKVPSGVITFTFDHKEASTSSREVNKDDKDIQPKHHISPGTEGATSDGATTSTRSSFLHIIHGDSNFNGPGFLSGPVANSGHIPYSGSISIRSDSSTTSARSFAFPILQSEWNSSPVKMAKARRRGRKLFCCRF